MQLNPPLKSRIESLIESDRIVLFMKGTRMQPMCGFSAATIGILDSLMSKYTTFNVLEDQGIREGIKAFSEWPTIPQLYIDKEFVGGCDIVKQMFNNGELHEMLGRGCPGPDLARDRGQHRRRRDHHQCAPSQSRQCGASLHRRPLAAFVQPRSGGRARDQGRVERSHGGVRRRVGAEGEGAVDRRGRDCPGDRIQDRQSQCPAASGRMSPSSLAAARREAGSAPMLVDVRTADERARALIEGSILLDDEGLKSVSALPKDTKLVFYCHTGVRSQSAARALPRRGFHRRAQPRRRHRRMVPGGGRFRAEVLMAR